MWAHVENHWLFTGFWKPLLLTWFVLPILAGTAAGAVLLAVDRLIAIAF